MRVGNDCYRVGSLLTEIMPGPSEAAAAAVLCAYLRDVEAARPALTRHDRVRAVVAGLDGHSWLNRSTTPLAGSGLDVTRHLRSALTSLGVHCYLGRLVEGEVAPSGCGGHRGRPIEVAGTRR